MVEFINMCREHVWYEGFGFPALLPERYLGKKAARLDHLAYRTYYINDEAILHRPMAHTEVHSVLTVASLYDVFSSIRCSVLKGCRFTQKASHHFNRGIHKY